MILISAVSGSDHWRRKRCGCLALENGHRAATPEFKDSRQGCAHRHLACCTIQPLGHLPRSFFPTGLYNCLLWTVAFSFLLSTLGRCFVQVGFSLGWQKAGEKTLKALVLCSRPTMDALQLANSAFAVDLFKKLCEQEPAGNVLFSPICLSTSLSLVQVGAKGDTANEIGQVSPAPVSAWRGNSY